MQLRYNQGDYEAMRAFVKKDYLRLILLQIQLAKCGVFWIQFCRKL